MAANGLAPDVARSSAGLVIIIIFGLAREGLTICAEKCSLYISTRDILKIVLLINFAKNLI